MSITDDLKAAAFRLGFDRVAITSADPLLDTEAIMRDRIDRGLFAGMDWFTAERAHRACRPSEHVPDARSIVSLAMSYLSDAPEPLSRPGEPCGQVSRFAWGPDYHGYVAERAELLCRYLRERHGAVARPKACVDTAAVAERAVAQRSGLGWFGKNTMLLTHHHGSWVFLAEIITDLPLTLDQPVRTQCGTCRRCQDICPTHQGHFITLWLRRGRYGGRCVAYRHRCVRQPQ